MKRGDYGLSQIQNRFTHWWVNIAQALTGDSSRYTHAFVYVGGGMVVEAQPGGAILAPLSKYSPIEYIHSDLELTDQQRADIVKAALSLVGTPYSFVDYLQLALLHFGIKWDWLRKRIADRGHMICSQLVDECYLRAGVHLFDDGRWPQDVTPGDLLYVLITNKPVEE